MDVPAHLHDPIMLPGADDILGAFWELSSDRPVGFGLGQIPSTAIERYATRNGIDDLDDYTLFAKLIRVCDAAFLKHYEKPPSGSK